MAAPLFQAHFKNRFTLNSKFHASIQNLPCRLYEIVFQNKHAFIIYCHVMHWRYCLGILVHTLLFISKFHFPYHQPTLAKQPPFRQWPHSFKGPIVSVFLFPTKPGRGNNLVWYYRKTARFCLTLVRKLFSPMIWDSSMTGGVQLWCVLLQTPVPCINLQETLRHRNTYDW